MVSSAVMVALVGVGPGVGDVIGAGVLEPVGADDGDPFGEVDVGEENGAGEFVGTPPLVGAGLAVLVEGERTGED